MRYDITSDPLYARLSTTSPSNNLDNGIYWNVILSLYRDREGKMPANPAAYIKFNLRIKSSRVQYKWDNPNAAWGSITKDKDVVSFTQNNFRETRIIAYENFPFQVGKWQLTFDPFEGNFFKQIKKADVDAKASYITLENGLFYQVLKSDMIGASDYTNGRGDLNEMVNMNKYNWGNRPD